MIKQFISMRFGTSMNRGVARKGGAAVGATESRSHAYSRYFSASSDESSSPCDVIQGPSLLRTPIVRPSPSLLFLPGLRSLPFWTSEDHSRVAYGDPNITKVVQHLEAHATEIQKEYETVAPTVPSDYENTDHNPTALHQGKADWKWHTYLNKGNVQGNFCLQFPQTAKVLQSLRDEGLLFEGTPFGFSFFSTLGSGSTIAAHTAPMNLRLRIHLPLIVPPTEKSEDDIGIRVGNQKRNWETHKAMVFDDAFDHEVWNHTSGDRVLLLVDTWHPDIPIGEREAIIQMFQEARLQGLWQR